MGYGEVMAMVVGVYNKEFGRMGWMRDDLVSEGLVGYMKAERTYRETRGVKFSTYAWGCIRKQMLMYVRREMRIEGGQSGQSLEEVIEWQSDGEAFDDELVIAPQKKLVEIVDKMEREFGTKAYKVARELVRAKTQKEVADKFGVSRQYIHSVYCLMKQKIREKYKYEYGEIREK